jgi:hypothetical protein
MRVDLWVSYSKNPRPENEPVLPTGDYGTTNSLRGRSARKLIGFGRRKQRGRGKGGYWEPSYPHLGNRCNKYVHTSKIVEDEVIHMVVEFRIIVNPQCSTMR